MLTATGALARRPRRPRRGLALPNHLGLGQPVPRPLSQRVPPSSSRPAARSGRVGQAQRAPAGERALGARRRRRPGHRQPARPRGQRATDHAAVAARPPRSITRRRTHPNARPAGPGCALAWIRLVPALALGAVPAGRGRRGLCALAHPTRHHPDRPLRRHRHHLRAARNLLTRGAAAGNRGLSFDRRLTDALDVGPCWTTCSSRRAHRSRPRKQH